MIPTAEEIFILETSEFTTDNLEDWEKQHILDAMIEFAKLHLTEFKNNIENKLKSTCNVCMMSEEISTNFESILNAYNLDNIK